MSLDERIAAILERTKPAPGSQRFGRDILTLERPPAERVHDLPPRWDGQPVTWGDWSIEAPTTLVFHMGPEAFACPRCGTVEHQPLRCRGRYADIGGLLTATRCPHCAHDQVYDFETGELYDLEASDYGDEGST
jgi:hypothetical protein